MCYGFIETPTNCLLRFFLMYLQQPAFTNTLLHIKYDFIIILYIHLCIFHIFISQNSVSAKTTTAMVPV